MTPLNFVQGDTLYVRDDLGHARLWRVQSRKQAGYLLQPLDDGDPQTWSDVQIADLYFARRLTIHPFNVRKMSERAVEAIEKTWEFWPEEARRTAERRKAYVDEVERVKDSTGTMLEAYQLAADNVHQSEVSRWHTQDLVAYGQAIEKLKRRRSLGPIAVSADPTSAVPLPIKPKAYTVRDWYIRYSNNGRDIRLLIPYHHKRGNRKPRFPKLFGDRPDQYKLMATVCGEVWLSQLKVTKSYVWKRYKKRCELNGLRPLSYRTLRLYINKTYDDFAEFRARHGSRAAYLKYGIFERRRPPERPLEEVEIDHCLLDIWIIDPISGKPVGRPWITAIIDRATRAILGVHISYEASYASVQRAIAHALWPKDLRDFDDITNTWDCHGLWDILFTDNGKEFRGDSLKATANILDFSIIFLPVKSPWLKGVIERFWQTLNIQVFSHEEGSTLATSKDHYDPRKSTTMTMEELRKLVLQWIVDDYHQAEHHTLKCSPQQRWHELVNLYPVRPVPSFDFITQLTGEVIKRQISNVGVQIDGLLYADRDNNYKVLKSLIRRRGGQSKEWMVRRDPQDFGRVWILDDEIGQWLELPCTEPAISNGVSKYQHRIHTRLAKQIVSKGKPVTTRHLAQARADAEAQAQKILQEADTARGTLRAARYASSPGFVTPMGALQPEQLDLGIAADVAKSNESSSAQAMDKANLKTAEKGVVALSEPQRPSFDYDAAIAEEMASWA